MVTFYVTHWHKNTPKQDKDLLKWDLYEVKNGEYIKITTFKEGKLQFSEKEIGNHYIVVGYLYEPELHNASAMKIHVVPTEKMQILSVEVRDINDNKITKPLSYGQKIKVFVRTTGLQGAKLNIDLWEDDETGGGHNDKNTKVSVASQLVPVGKNGIATTEMLIPVNFKKYAEAHGDNGKESAEHEYYVTAYHDGTQREASGNINFTNTKTPTQRKEETRDHLEQKPKRTEPVRGHRGRARKDPPTPTPSRSTPAPASPPAQQQPSQPRAVKKEITTVYITDANDKKISGTVKSGIVKVHILSTGLVGRDIRFKFYEEDVTENELVFEQKFKITKDHFIVDVTLNKVSANKGDDYFEGSEQEFFVDIEVLDTHAHIKSETINVDVKAINMDVPVNVSKTKVEVADVPESNKPKDCVCKQYDLTWGGHPNVSCDFRKKVVEISKRQNFDPNHLMAVMWVESAKTFSPSKIELKVIGHKKNGKPIKDYVPLNKKEVENLSINFSGAVGLIQFTPVAIDELNNYYNYNLTKRKLALMTQIEQLFYVEKYIEYWKKANKIQSKLTLADLYLLVFSPSKMNGSNDNTTLYKEGTTYYKANSSIDTDKENGITKKELAKRAYDSLDEGNKPENKTKVFSCAKTQTDTLKKTNLPSVLDEMKTIADSHRPYLQETNKNRTADTESGWAKMDCSEFVSRYLHKLGVTTKIIYMTTANMLSENKFRKVIDNNNIDFITKSDEKTFKPQKGDIFVWGYSKNGSWSGHTGVVYEYNSTNDTVTILEAIGKGGAVGEKKQVKNGGHSGTGCTRTAIYDRLGGALCGHKGWVGYFRPKNYTKKL
ncbi:MAG: CHAP domain-containing protein [Limnohabitans sp.]|nr:CHAP domain-containing protein [Limnohabitans sp.]